MDGLGESCGKGYTVMIMVIGMVTVTAIMKGTALLGEDKTVHRTVLVMYENSCEKTLKMVIIGI